LAGQKIVNWGIGNITSITSSLFTQLNLHVDGYVFCNKKKVQSAQL